MKYELKQNYWKGVLLLVIVVFITLFFIKPIDYNSQSADYCYDSGRGLICE